jgi:hypothetical protein
MAASGIGDPSRLNRHQISRRVFMNEVKTFEEIYPSVPVGAMVNGAIPEAYIHSYQSASAEQF